MKRLHSAGLRHLIMLMVVGALMAIPALVLAADAGTPTLGDTTMHNLTVRLTGDGIMKDASSNAGGLYLVTVTNDTSAPRGIKMTGHDLAGSPYVRYTKVLAPGQSQMFRWYFPMDTSANIVDLLRCEYAARTCAIADLGNMNTSIDFS